MELEMMMLIAMAGLNAGLSMAVISLVKKKHRKRSRRRMMTQQELAAYQAGYR